MLFYFRVTFHQKLLFLFGYFTLKGVIGVNPDSDDHLAVLNLTKSSLDNLTAENKSAFVFFYSNR